MFKLIFFRIIMVGFIIWFWKLVIKAIVMVKFIVGFFIFRFFVIDRYVFNLERGIFRCFFNIVRICKR